MNHLEQRKFIDAKAEDIHTSYDRIMTLRQDIEFKKKRLEKEVKEIDKQITSQLNLIRMAVNEIWNVTDPVEAEGKSK